MCIISRDPLPLKNGQEHQLEVEVMDVSSSVAEDSVSTAARTVLASLSQEDVDLLDAVIDRSSSATTFTTVFKAYNEILDERGLSAVDDIVYYKFLLKLGVIKGKTWGEKWNTAKAQNGLATSHNASKLDPRSESRVTFDKPARHIPRVSKSSLLTQHESKPPRNLYRTKAADPNESRQTFATRAQPLSDDSSATLLAPIRPPILPTNASHSPESQLPARNLAKPRRSHITLPL